MVLVFKLVIAFAVWVFVGTVVLRMLGMKEITPLVGMKIIFWPLIVVEYMWVWFNKSK